MSIIISKQGQPAQKIDRAEFEKEDYLQNYIHENPESIPVYEIEEDKKLLVVAREFPTESGPIDALAIDKDGDIYIVETKLYKNPDKRTVVAQALDYGASLWKHLNDFAEFTKLIDSEIQAKFHLTLEEKAKDFFGIEGVDFMLERMGTNLKEGNLKFVILMDSIDERLKDLIIYVNQNSQFDIYAVQLEYYKFNEYEIMIPKIFGVEVKKNIRGSAGSMRKIWTKDEFLRSARENLKEPGLYQMISNLYEFSEKNADSFEMGMGKTGSFHFKVRSPKAVSGIFALFSVYLMDGSLQISFNNVKKNLGKKWTEKYYESFSKLPFLKKWKKEQLLEGYSPGILLQDAFPDENSLNEFKSAVLEFTKEIK